MEKSLTGTKEQMFFKDFWKIIQKYFEPEENDKYWEQLKDELDNCYKRYDNLFLARVILGALLDYFEYSARVNEYKKCRNALKYVSKEALKTALEQSGNTITINGEKYFKLSDL